jgi:hypothetical protein
VSDYWQRLLNEPVGITVAVLALTWATLTLIWNRRHR